MAIIPFRPMFLNATQDIQNYGLPTIDQQPDIINKIQTASVMIDEYCGKTDTDGNGSLVYTTYTERIILPEGRNVFRVAFRPMVSLSDANVASLAASGSVVGPDGLSQPYYTGCVANTSIVQATGDLSAIVSASGRYGYKRRGAQAGYPDTGYGANILQVASLFGGPPQWTPIDLTITDYDVRSGEVWVPAGLYLSQYTEVLISYNTGFHPARMPNAVKDATAMLVRNLLSRGGGASALKSLQVARGGVGVTFTDALIDSNIQQMLQPYMTVRAY